MKKVLIHFHIYYLNCFEYYAKYLDLLLKCVPEYLDIIITLSSYNNNIFINIDNYFKNFNFTNYKIIKIKNIGADIAPMIYIFENNLCNIDDYISLIHIHTKNPVKFTNFNEMKKLWGHELIRNLFNLEYKIKYLIKLFESNAIGIAGNNDLYLKTDNNIKNNSIFMNELKNKYNLDDNLLLNSKFIAGNMWWCNINIIKLLLEKVKYSDFQKNFSLDGNLEHTIERFVGVLSNKMGYKYCGLTDYEIKIL